VIQRYHDFVEQHCAAVDAAAKEDLEKFFAEADLDYLLEEIPPAVSQSLDGVGQVARIVLAMKEFSHPGEREKVAVDLNRAIENTLAVSRNEWKHVAEVDMDLESDLPQVLCLPGEMNQVLLNLVVNAAHAIQARQLPGKGLISVATRRHGRLVDIIVKDDGVGMSEAIKERIFDPFFTTKAVGKGTGQGLAICRDVVVTKHLGKISVDTEEGKGTVFTIRLPIDGKAGALGGE
jgi:signal transduction histidine kinase